MKATILTLASAALAAGTFLLTGCDPSNTAGGSGASGGDFTCDPNGWGPLSGCDNSDGSSPTPTAVDTPSCEAVVSGRDLDAGGVNDTRDGSEQGVTDGNDCVTGSRPEFEQEVRTEDQKTTEAAEDGFTVTVTWIVVSIEVTGFRECVIDLREAPPNPDDHFSRRITTPEDCEAQQVDAVYRPVGE